MMKKIFLVWEEPTTQDESGYWNQYESLEDAVSDQGDGVEVYYSEPKYLGKFKRKAEIVKIKRRKKRK